MGLAVVELGMAIEDEFQVSIPDAVYGDLKTAGCLHWWICRQLGVPEVGDVEEGLCLNLAAFVRIRRALVSVIGVSSASVRLPLRLEDILPRNYRREIWGDLAMSSGIEWPELQHSWTARWFRRFAFIAVAVVSLATAFRLLQRPMVWLAFPLVPFAAIAMTFLIDRVCRPNELPGTLTTVGDLTVSLADSNALHLRSLIGNQIATREFDIWQRVRAIISDKLDVPLSDIQMNSRFIEDLHAD